MTQDTQTTIATTDAPPPIRPNLTIEVVKRNQPRTLPCKLTDEEMLRIARMRVAKEAERDQLVEDADNDAKARKAQIKKYDDEINVMRRELHTGQQDRTVQTNHVFEKDDKGNCWIVVYRNDTGEPTKEKWPASAAEMQRHLPMEEQAATGGLLGQAEKMQRSAQPVETKGDVPEGLPDAESDDEDKDGASKKKPNGKKAH